MYLYAVRWHPPSKNVKVINIKGYHVYNNNHVYCKIELNCPKKTSCVKKAFIHYTNCNFYPISRIQSFMKQKINDCLPSNETILAFDKEKKLLKWALLKKQQEK